MKLFGTDGVRGVAGELLTTELAEALGRAATQCCKAARPQILIVRDTRESGPMLERALAAGIAGAGGDPIIAGVLPTPAASLLVRRLGLDLAAVVSASHNPWRDNGIKFFGASGTKLDDETEAAIEARLAAPGAGPLVEPTGAPGAGAATEPAPVGSVRTLENGLDDYLRELTAKFDGLALDGREIVLDCANGATFEAAPAIFRRLGAEVELLGAEPDGRNINAGCGSTHPERLAERVADSAATIGFAFDGDGDRVVAVDGAGRVRDGDELIALIAGFLQRANRLAGDGVAVTVMSNFGLRQAMEAAGIRVAITPVGDRSVSSELEARGWSLGGEQSGHIIWTDFAPTGDGIAAALLLLLALGGRELTEASPIERLPQVLRNVEISDRSAVADAAELWGAVERENAALEGRGRVLVRPSGTEPLLRVMVEAPSEEECERVCSRLVAVVEETLA